MKPQHGTRPRITPRRKRDANHNTTTDANLESNPGDAALRKNETARIPAPCRIHFHHVRGRLADMDGLSVKAVLDGIVHVGVFPDDSPEFIEEISHSQAKGKPEKTVITIECIGEQCDLCDGLGGYAIVGSTGPGQLCPGCNGTGRKRDANAERKLNG